PFEDESFDFIFLTSVFTHMLPDDMKNYFSEISRTLKNGGRTLVTFFLFNNESSELIAQQKSTLDFKYEYAKYRTVNSTMPEQAVCYDESFILDLYNKYGFDIQGQVHYGSWCGRGNTRSYQDIVIARRLG
ncbi:MAG: class I SAM-dependent methyltransferase, partial [Candidatus Omnitrophota bacterium]|nr:class I SAM-dependent methyltransferase [Candidatus Omnitrophota bacterium]